MFENVVIKFMKKVESKRSNTVEKIYSTDSLCNDYLLKGTYSYEEVMALNALTCHSVYFGNSIELGHVALIGIPKANFIGKNGFFLYNIHEFGLPFDERDFYVRAYSLEEAKQIQDYTVFGILGLDKISKAYKKIQYTSVYNVRYKDENDSIS